MRATLRLLVVAGIAAAFIVPATAAGAASKFTPLTLDNGWVGGPYNTAAPAVADVAGVITFKGGLFGGFSPEMFVLPTADRPAADVYLHTGAVNATDAEIYVNSSDGEVDVFPTGPFSDAQSFVSLDGLSFTLSEKGAKPLALANDWQNAPRAAAVRTIAGVVRLQGSVFAGLDDVITVLPKAYWPKDRVVVSTDLCGGVHGMIAVNTDGEVDVVPSSGNFSDAQCLTSLDGVNWLKADSTGNAKALTLENGWQNGSTLRPAGLHVNAKVVRFAGLVESGTAGVIGTIPAKDAPATDVYIPAVVCGPHATANGRLHITPAGVVDVEPASLNLADASCATSFEGSWFAQ